MPLVMNASSKEQTVQVHGAWFTFNPGQIKEMNDDKVHFLTSTKSYMGFVGVPDKYSDIDARNSESGKKELEEIRATGVSNRIKHLEWLRANEIQSLRKDMDKQNIKAEVESEYTSESFAALKSALQELKTYKTRSADKVKERADELRALEADLADALDEE